MGRKSTIGVLPCCDGYKEGEKVALILFTECIPPLDAVADALGCVRLQ